MFGCNTILPVFLPYTAIYLQHIQTCTVSLCVIKHEAVNTCGWSWNIASRIPKLGSSWRLVVRFRLRPLYTQSNSRRFTLNRRPYRLVGLDALEKRKNFLPSGESNAGSCNKRISSAIIYTRSQRPYSYNMVVGRLYTATHSSPACSCQVQHLLRVKAGSVS